MASITRLFTVLSLIVSSYGFSQTKLPDELPAQSAIDAYKQYWGAFEDYEEKSLADGRKRHQEAWREVQRRFLKEKRSLNNDQISILSKAAKDYRGQLENHPDAENRPFVMLNLAQVLNMLGEHYALNDKDAGKDAKADALMLLRDIENNHKNFDQREKALYLRALLLEAANQREQAQDVWKILAAIAQKSMYGVHARLAVGDNYFQIENPAAAMRYYQSALELLPTVSTEDFTYEKLRINYRLAWSAYRAAELDQTISAATELLLPGQSLKSTGKLEKIQSDAIELIGDSLFEANNPKEAQAYLLSKSIKKYAPDIGLRILTRYTKANIHNDAAKLGDFLTENFALSSAAPQILNLTAGSYKNAKQPTKRIETLEKLTMLLPKQSLWRSRHKDDFETVAEMEKLGRDAGIVIAGWYYDKALSANNARLFMTAASYYEVLLENEPNNEESNTWRLRHAHCFYFAMRFKEASRLYTDLKSNYKIDAATLQIASYQLVLTNEKFWREQFNNAVQQDKEPANDSDTIAALTSLEKSIDQFAARFPTQTRSVDLLLVGASSNRDMDKFERASNYWQRVMVSSPDNAQRGIAIRGLVFASMKNGSSSEVIQIAGKFLKLENWKSLGLNLGKELKGILSVAALDEGKRLNNKGDIQKAGALLTSIAKEFPDIPNRDKILRDGAYMLAISGNWEESQEAVEGYKKSGMTRNLGDIIYLEARAHEYQMQMGAAAKSYLELGEKFPKHSRARSSLESSEKLALAENDFVTAASASALLAERSAGTESRLQHYTRTVNYLEKAKAPKKALAIAQRRLKSSRTTSEIFSSEIMVARMMYLVGNEQEALDDLVLISKRIRQKREKLSKEQYGALTGEAYFLLGLEAKRKFDDFLISERSGGLTNNVKRKTKYFDDVAEYMDKSAAGGHTDWAPRARYYLASSAEDLADEIASAATKNSEQLGTSSTRRYSESVDRLQQLAKKYYSTNILVTRKEPGKYRDNIWIKRSRYRLGVETPAGKNQEFREELPTAFGIDMPSQWSL